MRIKQVNHTYVLNGACHAVPRACGMLFRVLLVGSTLLFPPVICLMQALNKVLVLRELSPLPSVLTGSLKHFSRSEPSPIPTVPSLTLQTSRSLLVGPKVICQVSVFPGTTPSESPILCHHKRLSRRQPILSLAGPWPRGVGEDAVLTHVTTRHLSRALKPQPS